jgi:exodeoxyribonuclease VII large subunit
MDQLHLNLEAAGPKAASPSSTPKFSDDGIEPQSREPAVLSVSEVTRAIKSTLEGQYRTVWIKGEISNFKPHSSGHCYFSLKDAKAMISATMFRSSAATLRFKPRDGMEVVARGRISVYEPRGSYQIICEQMEPVGAGALQLAFENLKRKLQAEGLFDAARKRPLPLLPRHVAVVTSPTGAAIRDILNVLGRRFKGLRVTVVPAVVQGDAAAASICRALALAQQLSDVDVMIVGRGGGSIEDMWCFNDENVARAISSCRVPIVSAVGHEIDFTIADFVSDLRAPTPSAAAELVCKNAAEICEQVNTQKRRLWRAYKHGFDLHRHRIEAFTKRLVDPKRRLQDLMLRCDELAERHQQAVFRYLGAQRKHVQLAMSRLPSPRETVRRLVQQVFMLRTQMETQTLRGLEACCARWAKLAALLDAVSPLKVVERGFSITRKDGQLVKSADILNVGDRLEIQFARGKAHARVEKTEI